MASPQNRKTEVDQKNKTTQSFLLSLGVHSLILLIAFTVPHLVSHNEPTEIEITLDVPTESLEYLKDPKQLVEFDKKNDDQKADEKAKYLAAKNNTVKKETIARLDQQFKNVENQKSTPPQKNEARAENLWEKKSDNSASAKLFNTGFDVYDKMKDKNKNHQKTISQNSNPKEASTATDKLVGVDQSLMTQLNTREYKYYGYYTRIRTQLNQWWQPKVQEKVSKLMSKGRTIASDANKNTKVIIVLNDVGSLVKVQVLGASGVRELDDAAVEAFRQAAPFPNPPKGLIEQDGTIKIRWDFIVES